MSARSAAATLGLVILGYFAATIAATVVTVILMFTPSWLTGGPVGQVAADPDILPGAFFIGFFYTFFCAWPGFIVAILVGERWRFRGWLTFAGLGTLNVVPSLAICTLIFGSPFAIPAIVIASFPGGFAGGAAYWFTAGRSIAARRTLP